MVTSENVFYYKPFTEEDFNKAFSETALELSKKRYLENYELYMRNSFNKVATVIPGMFNNTVTMVKPVAEQKPKEWPEDYWKMSRAERRAAERKMKKK